MTNEFEKRKNKLNSGTKRFVHYTSASAAMSIIKDKEIWLRNVACMNDYSEVVFGINKLKKAFSGVGALVIKQRLNALHADLFQSCVNLFDENMQTLITQTYILCFSEHMDTEDGRGRLSMWRGYGSGAKVAIVINSKPFLSESGHLGIFSNEVNYIGGKGLLKIIDTAIENLEVEMTGLGCSDLTPLCDRIYCSLVELALTTKHIGFEEEREWRIYQTSAFRTKTNLEDKIVDISGVPQKVKVFKFKDYTKFGLEGADLESLLDRVIIGPSEDQLVLYDTFLALLKDTGIENPEQKVFISDIPYRA